MQDKGRKDRRNEEKEGGRYIRGEEERGEEGGKSREGRSIKLGGRRENKKKAGEKIPQESQRRADGKDEHRRQQNYIAQW